jgi:hypothetical protein
MGGVRPEGIEVRLARRVGDVDGWDAEPLAHNRWLTAAIWRVRAGGSSFVVKRLREHPPPAPGPYEAHGTARSSPPVELVGA